MLQYLKDLIDWLRWRRTDTKMSDSTRALLMGNEAGRQLAKNKETNAYHV